MAELLRRDARVRVLNDVVLNQVLVRFGDSDDVTRATIARAQREGTCWMAGTTWHGLAAMRISVSAGSGSGREEPTAMTPQSRPPARTGTPTAARTPMERTLSATRPLASL